ncbi:MAG: hypothetical protein AAGG50_00285 [Bacteroidota bacterium]
MRSLRLACLLALVTVPVAGAQSLPDWAAPQPYVPVPDPEPLNAGPQIPGAPAPAGPAPVPIDGGLGLLALAGAGYAARRLHQQRAD